MVVKSLDVVCKSFEVLVVAAVAAAAAAAAAGVVVASEVVGGTSSNDGKAAQVARSPGLRQTMSQ